MAPLAAAALLVLLLLLAVLIVHSRRRPTPPHGLARPPRAPGSVPLLGHALAYKRDPAAFLAAACARVGPIFQLNLAGKHMIVVASAPEAVKQVAMAPESAREGRPRSHLRPHLPQPH